VQEIRDSPLSALQSLVDAFLSSDALPHPYLDSLDDRSRAVALRACLIVQIMSRYRIIPCQYQLEANNSLEDRLDVIVNCGTSGKT
ncbi:hypothetical protein C8R45DRAFT_791309, partial [Mycena sanguinolenta]